MDFAVVHLGLLVLAAGALIYAAVSDVRRYRIPNGVSLLLLLLFPFYAVTAPDPVNWLANLGVFGALLAVGLVLFALRIAGAGDVKVIAVTGLWIGFENLALYLVVTALAGGVLSLGFVIRALINKRAFTLSSLYAPSSLGAAFWSVLKQKIPVPYGVALAVGGLAAFEHMAQPYLMMD